MRTSGSFRRKRTLGIASLLASCQEGRATPPWLAERCEAAMSQMLRQKSLRTLSSAVASSAPLLLKETLLQERWCLTRRGMEVRVLRR